MSEHHHHHHEHAHDHDHGECCGHDHGPGHTHTHDGHTHSHDEGDTYYIDQLCMVGLSGAFGAICLSLYFWQQTMLKNLLGPQFHVFILLSGIALVLIALVRGYTLWFQPAPPHTHDHGELTVLDEGPGHHHHHHGHGHHLHHDHDAVDHDHGWAPWRYVVLLIPIVLFLLGLPNKGREVEASDVNIKVDTTQEAVAYARLLGVAPLPLNALGSVPTLHAEEPGGPVFAIDYKTLEAAANDSERRSYWDGKTVEVRGQFSPDRSSQHVFSLARLRISCCAADSIQLNVPIVSKEPIKGIAPGEWVKVTGKVTFVTPAGGSPQTVIRVARAARVEKCPPDTNPYIQ